MNKKSRSNSPIRPVHRVHPADRSPQGRISPAEEFSNAWETLFKTPIHLDSLLSKQSKDRKGLFAQIFSSILLRPVSLAADLKVSLPAKEPWALKPEQLETWEPAMTLAARMAQRLEDECSSGAEAIKGRAEDFPPEMISEWRRDWGAKKMEELAEILSQEPPMSLRASRRVGAKKLRQDLIEAGALTSIPEVSRLAPLGVRFSKYSPVLKFKPFEEGNFEIQDEGSQVMALFALWPKEFSHLLKSEPGQVDLSQAPLITEKNLPSGSSQWTIVDACAGAGGKSLAMADVLKGKGRVFAYDVVEKKLQALRRRVTRANLNNIQTVLLDETRAETQLEKFSKKADVVLVDAPCSGWGVLRRNPDIKWRHPTENLEKMPGIQLRLLQLYSELVKPGGRLVFGVCTFRQAETTDVVLQFLKANPHFKTEEGGFLGPGPCDGFFMQNFMRLPESP